MYRVQLAYRHENGEVEGFVGQAFTEEAAERDCLEQMRIKVEVLARDTFQLSRVIRKPKELTPAEFQSVKRDWNTDMGYYPDGRSWPQRNAPPGTSGLRRREDGSFGL